jgi:hypothetical protein
MKDTRRNRIWTLAGVVALALTAGIAANQAVARRVPPTAIAVEDGLRDAIASPLPPATAGLAGRPVPTSWFKTPAQQHSEIDAALFASRNRRALARVAVR